MIGIKLDTNLLISIAAAKTQVVIHATAITI